MAESGQFGCHWIRLGELISQLFLMSSSIPSSRLCWWPNVVSTIMPSYVNWSFFELIMNDGKLTMLINNIKLVNDRMMIAKKIFVSIILLIDDTIIQLKKLFYSNVCKILLECFKNVLKCLWNKFKKLNCNVISSICIIMNIIKSFLSYLCFSPFSFLKKFILFG